MTVELFGMSRALAGRPTVELPIDGPVDYAGFLSALADAVPALVPDVIAASRDALVMPNLILLDGKRPVREGEQFTEHDRPCVLFLASGG